MSKRVAGIALLLGLVATGATAETPGNASYSYANDPVVAFGDSGWELFRPRHRPQEIYDLAYLTDDLRSRNPGYGLRFRSSPQLTFDLQFDFLARSEELYGPIYNLQSGATVFSVGFHF
jgi:hypothetical protein